MLIALAAAVVAAAPPITPPRLFEDWYVACDNTRRCAAVALLPDGYDAEAEFWTLSLWRNAGSDDVPEFYLQRNFAVPVGMVLVIDRRTTSWKSGEDDKLVGGNAATLAAQLASARSLAVADSSGKLIAHISPLGASAALRWLDDQQKRENTATALVAKGPGALRPVATKLPTIATPRRSAAAPAKLSRSEVESIRSRCGYVEPDQESVTDFYRLDSSTTLAIVSCGLGPYQGSSIIYLVSNDGNYGPALIERAYYRHPSEAPDPPNELVSAGFDTKTFSLTSSYRARGIGDCGGNEAYVWDGSRFRLAYQDIMDECRGSLERLPIWRTTNVPALPEY